MHLAMNPHSSSWCCSVSYKSNCGYTFAALLSFCTCVEIGIVRREKAQFFNNNNLRKGIFIFVVSIHDSTGDRWWHGMIRMDTMMYELLRDLRPDMVEMWLLQDSAVPTENVLKTDKSSQCSEQYLLLLSFLPKKMKTRHTQTGSLHK